MRMYDILFKKRQGEPLTAEEIGFFIKGYTRGEIPDYQASALLMALFLKGIDDNETTQLTEFMMHSGDTIDLSGISGFKADKHSTGGVGDKTSLVLAPLVASFGVPMAKMSGRGLGHTGGTIDKLESIPGFSSTLTPEAFIHQVNEIGLAIIAQTQNIAPADKLLYALRDVTATVDHPGLIASSIMSKKLASGADGIMLDVKVGDGAFLKTLEEAIHLASLMVRLGERMKRKTRALLSNMDEPLGYAVGNSLEVIEAISTLKGNGPQDLTELCLQLSAGILVMAGTFKDKNEAYTAAAIKLKNGEAFAKFEQFVKAQGGQSFAFKPAKYELKVEAPTAGYVQQIHTQRIGEIASMLGAGRLKKDDTIDASAGILLHRKVGDKTGDYLATLYTDDQTRLEEAADALQKAYEIVKWPTKARPLIYGYVHKSGTTIQFEPYEKENDK